ncbi:MAG: hypothetical protein H8E25_03855 [Planctomycetes bacterium]|nr:hypothetical protein [Planctomycetota bacterium]
MLRTSLIFFLCFTALSCSDSAFNSAAPAPITDLDAELHRKNFIPWFKKVYPSHSELRWRILGWQLNVKSGFDLTKQSKKPLLLWLEDGHPMGSTSQHGRDLRATLGEDSLIPLLNKYSLAAADFNRAPEFISADTGQLAVYLPDGHLLDSHKEVDKESIAAFLERAHAKFIALPSEQLADKLSDESFASAIRTENGFPDDGLSLETFQRPANTFLLDDFQTTQWQKDFVWFNQDEMSSFIRPIKINSKNPIKNELLHRISGGMFSEHFEFEDMVKGDLVFQCRLIKKNYSTYLISGTANYQRGTSSLKVKMFGKASYDTDREQFGLLEITALSEFDDGSSDAQRFATALRKVTSVDNWHRVPPKNLADYAADYYRLSGSGNPNK